MNDQLPIAEIVVDLDAIRANLHHLAAAVDALAQSSGA